MSDLMNFLEDVESAFGIRCDDDRLAEILTPGQLIDHITELLPPSRLQYRIWDRMYDRLASVLAEHIDVEPESIQPMSPLKDLFPSENRELIWKQVQSVVSAKHWPAIEKHMFGPDYCRTIGEVVDFLVARSPLIVKELEEGWTRDQIAEVIQCLCTCDFGIPVERYSEDARVVKDWGIDDF